MISLILSSTIFICSFPYSFPRSSTHVSVYPAFVDYRLPKYSKWPCLWPCTWPCLWVGKEGWRGHNRIRWEVTWGQDPIHHVQDSADKPHLWNKAPSLSNNQGPHGNKPAGQPQGTAMRKGSGDHLPLRAQDPAGSKLPATLGSPISGGCGWAQAGPKGRAGVGRDGLWLTSPQLMEQWPTLRRPGKQYDNRDTDTGGESQSCWGGRWQWSGKVLWRR